MQPGQSALRSHLLEVDHTTLRRCGPKHPPRCSVFGRNKRPVHLDRTKASARFSRPGRKPALRITCSEHGALVDVGSVGGGVDALQLPPQQPAARSAVVPLRAVDPDHATPRRSELSWLSKKKLALEGFQSQQSFSGLSAQLTLEEEAGSVKAEGSALRSDAR